MVTYKVSLKREVLVPNSDIVKDAFINAIVKTGIIEIDSIIGRYSKDLSISPVIRGKKEGGYLVKDIFIRSIDPVISHVLSSLDLTDVKKEQYITNSTFDASDSYIEEIIHPVLPGTNSISCLFLTPFLMSKPKEQGVNRKKNGDRYYTSIEDLEYINERINQIIERKIGKKTNLEMCPDKFYLSSHDYIARFYPIKNITKDKVTKIPGLMFPFILKGSDSDLLIALNTGIGEKNKIGFGAFHVIGG